MADGRTGRQNNKRSTMKTHTHTHMYAGRVRQCYVHGSHTETCMSRAHVLPWCYACSCQQLNEFNYMLPTVGQCLNVTLRKPPAWRNQRCPRKPPTCHCHAQAQVPILPLKPYRESELLKAIRKLTFSMFWLKPLRAPCSMNSRTDGESETNHMPTNWTSMQHGGVPNRDRHIFNVRGRNKYAHICCQ